MENRLTGEKRPPAEWGNDADEDPLIELQKRVKLHVVNLQGVNVLRARRDGDAP